MGLNVLEIEIANPSDPAAVAKLECQVESWAIYSVVPGPIPKKLGIKPIAEQTHRLADGLLAQSCG